MKKNSVRFYRFRFFTSIFLSVLFFTLSNTAVLAQKTIKCISLDEIKDYITECAPNCTPDEIIAGEIERRGINFTPTLEAINKLKNLGAGNKTLAILKTKLSEKQPAGDCISDKVRVLVANFDGSNNQDNAITKKLLDDLREAILGYTDIEIIALNEKISAQQGKDVAIAKGKEKKADLVLWGWYERSPTNVLISVHVEFTSNISQFLLYPSSKQEFNPQIKIYDSFAFHYEMSGKMTSLVLAVLGVIRFQAFDHAGAIKFFTAAISQQNYADRIISPSNIYLYRAITAKEKSEYDFTDNKKQIKSDLETAIKINPGNGLAHLQLALYNIPDSVSSINQSIEHAQKAINLANSNEARALCHLTVAFMNLMLDNKSQVQLHSEKANTLAANLQDNVMKYILLSFSSVISGNMEQALILFKKLIDSLKADVSLNQKKLEFLLANIYTSIGSSFLLKEDFDSAINYVNESIKLFSRNANAYTALGRIYETKAFFDLLSYNKAQAMNSFTQSENAYTQAINLSPGNAQLHFSRGKIYKRLGNTEKAIADFKKVLSLEPNSPEAQAEIYLLTNQYDLAVNEYRKLFNYLSKEDPELKGHKLNVFIHALLQIFSERRDFKAGIEFCNKILESNSKYVNAYVRRGVYQLQSGNYQPGIDDLGRAINLDPQNPEHYFLRADVFAFNNNLEGALQDLNQAIQLKRDNPVFYNARAIILHRQGKIQPAINDVKKAIRLSNSPVQAEEFKKHLNFIELELKNRY